MFFALPAKAKPPKGFNTGPYLLAEGGIMQANFDYDQYSNINVGHDWEPVFGVIFGWNIWDWFSAELEGKYGTNKKASRREHLVSANLNAKYFFITNALTDFPSLRIMPTVKIGASFRVAVLPGNPNSTDTMVTTFGGGPSLGGGVTCIWKKYFTFGFTIQEDLLFFENVRQTLTVNGTTVPNALIYEGGFKPQFSAMVIVGAHF